MTGTEKRQNAESVHLWRISKSLLNLKHAGTVKLNTLTGTSLNKICTRFFMCLAQP